MLRKTDTGDSTHCGMTVLGAGPKVAGMAFSYSALATLAHFALGELAIFHEPSNPGFVAAGAACIAGGIALWFFGVRVIVKAFDEGRLLTRGSYGVVRHPMYSGILIFVPLGIALLLRSWPILTIPLVTGLASGWLVWSEDEYLRGRFGKAFEDYEERVNALIPFVRLPRFLRRGSVPARGREALPAAAGTREAHS